LKYRLVFFLIVALLISSIACANLPSAAYVVIADEYKIPPVLLYAIAMTESGVTKNNSRSPWPWAVNHAGKGIYFDTREEAHAYLSQLLGQGKTNFDVGLMQVNWHWHHKIFDSSLWSSLDPYRNLRGGASILQSQYRRLGSYEKAVGAYHSPSNSARANAYRERVRDNLAIILNQPSQWTF